MEPAGGRNRPPVKPHPHADEADNLRIRERRKQTVTEILDELR